MYVLSQSSLHRIVLCPCMQCTRTLSNHALPLLSYSTPLSLRITSLANDIIVGIGATSPIGLTCVY